MAHVERRAHVVWEGEVIRGGGNFTVGSGAMEKFPITFVSRFERSDGKTSPEELIAAAHAGCYSMALSHALTESGNPPEQLMVDAVCAIDQVGEGFKITTVNLEVRGRVPGLDANEFEVVAEQAEKACPVSNALRDSVEITLKAHLEED